MHGSGAAGSARDGAGAATPSLAALRTLAGQLDQTPAQVATTLQVELTRALGEIDSGISAQDAEAVAHACHAARNSVLMLDDPPLMAALRAVESAIADGDRETAARQRREVHAGWMRLEAQLASVAAEVNPRGVPPGPR